MKRLVEFLINNKSTGIISDPNFVDLGLSVLWGKCNLGADEPQEQGLFYVWGDTQGYRDKNHHTFQMEFTKYFDNSIREFTKYNRDDNKKILDPEDDAVSKKLGNNYHTPTIEQFKELNENTTKKLMDGFVVSFESKINHNSIVIPIIGYISENSNPYMSDISLLTNELSSITRSNQQSYVYQYTFSKYGNTRHNIDTVNRAYGLQIRPVKDI